MRGRWSLVRVREPVGRSDAAGRRTGEYNWRFSARRRERELEATRATGEQRPKRRGKRGPPRGKQTGKRIPGRGWGGKRKRRHGTPHAGERGAASRLVVFGQPTRYTSEARQRKPKPLAVQRRSRLPRSSGLWFLRPAVANQSDNHPHTASVQIHNPITRGKGAGSRCMHARGHALRWWINVTGAS